MKKLLIPFILVATILVGGVMAYAIWKSVPVSAQDYFKSGKDYYEKHKYAEASVQLLNAVQKDPRNRDAHYFLALSYLNQKNVNAAAQQLSTLLDYYPDDIEASLRLGNLYLSAGGTNADYFRKADELAKKVLSKDAQNVAALILSGNSSAGLQDYGTAVELFEKAVALDPGNSSAFVSLGTAQAIQKKLPEAEQSFLKARQANPKDKSALISLANYYRSIGQPEKAESIFKEALTIYPSDKDIYVQVVEFYNQAGRAEDVTRVLQSAQTANPKDPSPSLILAGFYESRNRIPDARKLLFDLKKSYPDSVDVAGKLAANLLTDDPVRARTEIDQILKAEPTNATGLLLLAQIQFNSGQYDAIEETLRKSPALRESFPQPELLLGQVALKKGQIDEAQDHYQKSLSVNSSYVPARIALAELLMNRGRFPDSRTEVRKVLAMQPNLVAALILDATLDLTEKKYSDAEPKLTALVKDQPNNALVHRQVGLFYESRGRNADAEKSLVRALELQPDAQKGLQDLTQFYMRTKQSDKAIQRIIAIPDDKKQSFHYELLGLVYAQSARYHEAEKAYQMALEKDPSNSNSVGYLVALYIQTGELEEGLKELDVLIKKNPSSPAGYTVKGMIYEKQGKVEDAKKNYAQALKVDSNYETAGNNLAFILAEQEQDLNTALGWAQMARKRQPDSPGIADTLGWVYFKLGNYLLARDQLQFAVGKQPDNAVYQYHLAMIYKGNKQIPEAQNALKKAVSSPKDFKEKSLAQAELKQLSSLKF
jgi:tetratricopeptide (TPR) repeat protein